MKFALETFAKNAPVFSTKNEAERPEITRALNDSFKKAMKTVNAAANKSTN